MLKTDTEVSNKTFVPDNLNYDSWESLHPFYDNLKERSFSSVGDLKQWLLDLSDLDAAVSEHLGWLYIKMTCDTQDKLASQAYANFVTDIQPHISEYDDAFNKKLVATDFKKQLGEDYKIHLASVENQIRIFRQENIPLIAELTVKEQKYGEIAGEMSVEVEGKTLTLQQAVNYLRRQDRKIREEVYFKIASRRLQDRTELDNLFDELLKYRDRIARNADFANYRDYKFIELDRFDYTPEDCEQFHSSVLTNVVPVVDEILQKRKSELKVEKLKPWDLDVDTEGKPELKPFKNGEELTTKTIQCFYSIDPFFGQVVERLQAMKHLDLDSRIGKAPGGYNYPLYMTGVPFIFMNASGSLRDVITMVHEGGHAIHSILTHDLEFVGFKELPSEIAELASMSMELISMEHWESFFNDAEDLKRAKTEQLEGVLEALPGLRVWISFRIGYIPILIILQSSAHNAGWRYIHLTMDR